MGAAAPYITMIAGSVLSAYFNNSGQDREGFPGAEFANHMFDPQIMDAYKLIADRAHSPVDLGPGPSIDDMPSFAGGGGLPMGIGITGRPGGGTGPGSGDGTRYPSPTGSPPPGWTPPGIPSSPGLPGGPPPTRGPKPAVGGPGTPGPTTTPPAPAPAPAPTPTGPTGPIGPGPKMPPQYDRPQRLAFGAPGDPSDSLASLFGPNPPSTGAGGSSMGGLDPQTHGAIQLLMQLAQQSQQGQGQGVR